MATVDQAQLERWLQEEIDGELSGSAADGLRVVNESLLGELVGGVFSEWAADGELETRLQLELNLGDKTVAPSVDVHTRWRDVDLLINPGGLQLESLEQQLELLSSASTEHQEFSLRYTLEALQERTVQQQLNELVIDWMQGDVDALYEYMMQPLEDYPQLAPYLTAMFDDRNRAMSQKIATGNRKTTQYG